MEKVRAPDLYISDFWDLKKVGESDFAFAALWHCIAQAAAQMAKEIAALAMTTFSEALSLEVPLYWRDSTFGG